MGISEGHRTGLTCLNHDLAGGGIVIPQRIATRLIYFFDVVGTGCDFDGDDTAGIGGKGRTVQQLGAIHISIDVELPTA